MDLINREKAIEIVRDECGKYIGIAARIEARLNKLEVEQEKEE